jgi:protein TonB
MFERTLDSSWDERSRRGLTAITSFGLQVLAVGFLLVLPLLRPQGLPLFRQLSAPVSLSQSVGEPPHVRTSGNTNTAAPHNAVDIVLTQPPRIPATISDGSDDVPPPVASYAPQISEGMGAPGGSGGVFNSTGTAARPVMPAAPAVVSHPIHVSRMSEGDLVSKILPTYPPLARSARVQGTVFLQAVISKQGTIENLRLLSGHPMLAQAAIEAVSRWRYRPYILNGEPVEVETQITVNFSLAGN